MRNVLVFLHIILSVNVFCSEVTSFHIGNGRLVNQPLYEISVNDSERLFPKGPAQKHRHFARKPEKENSLKEKMTVPKDQGDRGTCTVFVTVGIMESYEGGDLSEQCLAKFSTEIDGGLTTKRITWSVENGLYTEIDCPYYNTTDGGRDEIPDLTRSLKIYPSGGFVETSQVEGDPIEYIKRRIDAGHPIGISIYVAGSGWAKPGIIAEPSDKEIEDVCKKGASVPFGKKKCAGHGLIVTGYNDKMGYLEFKNSWGPYWPKHGSKLGDGFGKLSYAYFLRMRRSAVNMVSK